MGRPVTQTDNTDFLLREGSSREEIGKWLKNKSTPWQMRRRLIWQLSIPAASTLLMHLFNIACTPPFSCIHTSAFAVHKEMCQWLPDKQKKKTIGHFQDAGCLLDKRRWSPQNTIRASGSCYKKSMCMGRRIDTWNSSRFRQKAGWARPALGGLQISGWLGSDLQWAGGHSGSCTSHPGVLGSIPKREEPGKRGAFCVKVPGFLWAPPTR